MGCPLFNLSTAPTPAPTATPTPSPTKEVCLKGAGFNDTWTCGKPDCEFPDRANYTYCWECTELCPLFNLSTAPTPVPTPSPSSAPTTRSCFKKDGFNDSKTCNKMECENAYSRYYTYCWDCTDLCPLFNLSTAPTPAPTQPLCGK